jgi:hypothetical protein
MTMLTHSPSYGRGFQPKPRRDADTAAIVAPAKESTADLIKRVCQFALSVALMTAVLAAIIGLKAWLFLPRFPS